MRGQRPVRRARLLRLTVAVGLLCCLSCLYSPPIEERPVDWDDPPAVPELEIEPPREDVYFIDRLENPRQTFGVGEVLDPDPPGSDPLLAITYEFSVVLLDDSGREAVTVDLGGDRLQVDAERTAQSSGTVYGGVDLTLDFCEDEDLRNVQSAIVRLRIVDPIPTDQQEVLGQTEWVLPIDWSVNVPDTCVE